MMRNPVSLLLTIAAAVIGLSLAACAPAEPELVRVYFYNESDIPFSSVTFTPAEGEDAESLSITSVIMPGGWLEVNVRGVLYSEVSANRAGGEPIVVIREVDLVTGSYDFRLTGGDGVYTIDLATHVDEMLPPPPTPDLGADG